MKTRSPRLFFHAVLLLGAGGLAACATMPAPDISTQRARTALTALQASPTLASRAPSAVAEAEQALLVAEAPSETAEEAAHLGYLAERRVEIAQYRASQAYAEEQLKTLSQERDRMQVASRARQQQAELARFESSPRTGGGAQGAFFLPPGLAPGTPAAAAPPRAVSMGKTRYYCTTSNNRYYCLTN